MPSSLKATLEGLLKRHRLQSEGPPLRGEDRRLSPLSTGIPALDGLLRGGFPRGEVSKVYGPASSGRTGLALSLVARSTQTGALAAWVDPGDRLDPSSAATLKLDLSRLLWLRGESAGVSRDGRASRGAKAVSAVGTLLGSGLFEIVVLDLASLPPTEIRLLPGATWLRLQRMVESHPAALLLLSSVPIAQSRSGISLSLTPLAPRWSALPGPGRLLRGLVSEARVGPYAARGAIFELQALA